jgi:peptide chain release factor
MRLIQISSGRGPAECELAAGKYLAVFLKEHPKAIIKEKHSGSYVECGRLACECYKSVLVEIPGNEEVKLGTVKWICQSPFRPKHKRKNWFVDVSEIQGASRSQDSDINVTDKRLIRFETFKSGGKGGQNVNKVETGVRVIHIPTGMAATSTTARTQLQNKKIAIDRLIQLLVSQNKESRDLLEENKWLEHEKIVRGNAFAVYEGMEFKQTT